MAGAKRGAGSYRGPRILLGTPDTVDSIKCMTGINKLRARASQAHASAHRVTGLEAGTHVQERLSHGYVVTRHGDSEGEPALLRSKILGEHHK